MPDELNTASQPEERSTASRSGNAQLDSLDYKILELLQQDGRMSYRQIARDLGVSEGTIRFRMNKLQSSDALRIVVIADPFQLGYTVLAFVVMKVSPAHHSDITEEISSWDEATYVSSLASTSDIFFQFVSRDQEHLHEILHERIPAIEGVISFETHPEVKIHKVFYGYPLPD